MHKAPSVKYPVGPCALYARLLVFLGLLGLLPLGHVWWQIGLLAQADGAWQAGLLKGLAGFALWMGWAWFARRSWLHAASGHIQWDARALSPAGHSSRLDQGAPASLPTGAWSWRSDAYRLGTALQRVDIVLDLQHHLLLRLINLDRASSWVWVERDRQPARWQALRRALVGSR